MRATESTRSQPDPSAARPQSHHVLTWLVRLQCVALTLGPAAFLLERLRASPVLVFSMAGFGMIPAAALLGTVTQTIASQVTEWDIRRLGQSRHPTQSAALGARVAGLLNASFGNLPELIFGALALQQGYVNLTKATLIGSVIGNAALVVGSALFVGGIRHGRQQFDSIESSRQSVVLILAVAGLALPSILLTQTGNSHGREISILTALFLLATYVAYLAMSVGGLRGMGRAEAHPDQMNPSESVDSGARFSLSGGIAILGVTTIAVFLASEAMIETVRPFTSSFGWTPFFVGIVIIPLLSNVAEHSTAVLLSYKNRADLALAISAGSSIQVAIFVTPVLVLWSQFSNQFDLVFTPVEITVLTLTVALFYFVTRGGESNWVEGLQLVILYAMAASVFFYLPGQL